MAPATDEYNCFAWAIGRTDILLDPMKVWPQNVPREYTLTTFIQCFAKFGFVCCDDGDVEPEFEKVAIYGFDNQPKHAARQTENGLWTSKIGTLELIEHHLDALFNATTEKAHYGFVIQFLKRPKIKSIRLDGVT